MLKTEDGTWSRKVEKDSRLFADILAPIVDLGSSDSEVVLSGSVGRVVSEQWTSVVELLEWKRLFDKYKYRGEAPMYFTHEMSLALGTPRDRLTQPHIDRPGVLFHEVNYISRVLNMPSGWESCVAISPTETITEDILNHVEAMGRHIVSLDDHYYDPIPDRPGVIAKRPRRRYAVEILFRVINQSRKDKTHANVVKVATCGVLQDALLRMEGDEVMVRDVNWSLLLALLERRCATEDQFYNIVATLAGKGDYTKETPRTSFTLVIPVQEMVVCSFGQRDRIEHLANVEAVYDACLLSFPDDVGTYLFGLESLLTRQGAIISHPKDFAGGSVNVMSTVVTWLHHNIIVYCIREGLGTLAIVRVLDYSIGRRGLVRILLALLHLQCRASGDDVDFEPLSKMVSENSVMREMLESTTELIEHYIEFERPPERRRIIPTVLEVMNAGEWAGIGL